MRGRTNALWAGALRPKGGFTLIEMLVTVTIIAILAGAALGALHLARETAREAKTKATIAKLHTVIMERYESYRTRRVPVRTSGMNPSAAAELRLCAIRQVMRVEMPDRFDDIVYNNSSDPRYLPQLPTVPLPLPNPNGGYFAQTMARPSLSVSYAIRYGANAPSTTYQSAECLYMVVTMGDSRSRQMFHDNEIGDADNDGWPEFIDGWGNPIYFLRWAPGFNDTDVQPVIIPPAQTGNVSWTDPVAQANKQLAGQNDHDPFDPMRVDETPPTRPNHHAWRLVPLIYSAGPDGIYDVAFYVSSSPSFNGPGDPYESAVGVPTDTDNTSVTNPGTANGSLDHYDNIHNHRIEAR